MSSDIFNEIARYSDYFALIKPFFLPEFDIKINFLMIYSGAEFSKLTHIVKY